jgi:hypothetical protein
LPVAPVGLVNVDGIARLAVDGQDAEPLHLPNVFRRRLETRHVEPLDLAEIRLGTADGRP